MNPSTALRTSRLSTRPSPFPHHRVCRSRQPATVMLALRDRSTHRQASSSATAAAAAAAAATKAKAPDSVMTQLDATSHPAEPLSGTVPLSATLNPPASTRPPPLDLPQRDPKKWLVGHLVATGRAYASFYRQGLAAIFRNRKLVRALRDTTAPPQGLADGQTKAVTGVGPTRAAALLRERTAHDLRRLPLFGLMLLVCGEFTPLVVLAFPKITPLTCRIPKQVAHLREKAAERRLASRRALRYVSTEGNALDRAAPGHIVRSLGLAGTVWDKAGVDAPFAKEKAQRAVDRIAADDWMIRRGGGVRNLEDPEVVIACEDRSVDVRNRDIQELRGALERWIQETTVVDEPKSGQVVRRLLLGLDVETT